MNQFFALVFSSLLFADAFAAESTLTVKIDGMTCPSCAASVEGQFMKLKEVSGVKINLSKGFATVTLKDGQTLTEGVVKDAVKKAGFSAVSIKSDG